MKPSVDYADAFSPVPHASGFRTLVALAAANDMEMDQIDISQAFLQGGLLPGDGRRGRVFIAPPPGHPEEEGIIWLLKPLYGMPQSARCWHLTKSNWLKNEGFNGYEKSMWCEEENGHKIIMGSHIDDFIFSTSRQMLDHFRKRLFEKFEGDYLDPINITSDVRSNAIANKKRQPSHRKITASTFCRLMVCGTVTQNILQCSLTCA